MAGLQRRLGAHDDEDLDQASLASKSASRGRFDDRTISLIYNHIVVFLFGFTAILGKLISYGSLFLVWHRVVIAFFVFLCFPQVWRDIALISYWQIGIYSLVGVILCLHWVAFYISVKKGDSVSITLTCMGTMAMFASILEPFILGVPFSVKDLLISVIVVCGIVQVYYSLPTKPPSEGVEVDYEAAIAWGILAPFLTALASVLNKAHIKKGTAISIATIEIGAAALFLTILVPLMYGDETVWYPSLDVSRMGWDTVRSGPFDLVWVLLLAVLGTNVCQLLGNKALNHLSAFTANLIGILEPIYGIILGALIFQENKDLSVDFYYGAGIILFALFANTVFAGIGEPASGGPKGIPKMTINPALEESIIAHVGPPGSAGAPASPTGSAKYVSSLRKPKMSPSVVGSHVRRASRAHSEDVEDDDTRPLLHNGNLATIPV